MIDPIGDFARIRDLYITYLETAFRIDDPSLAAERRRLLEAPGTLCTPPLLEPISRYRQVAWRIGEIGDLDDGPLGSLPPEVRSRVAALLCAGLFERADARP